MQNRGRKFWSKSGREMESSKIEKYFEINNPLIDLGKAEIRDPDGIECGRV